MKRLRNKFMLGFLVVLLMATVAGAAETANLTAISASPGGGWFAIMGATAEMIHEKDPSINIKAVPGSGAANALAVSLGDKAQMGFTFPPFAIAAMNSTEPFEGKPPATKLRAMFASFGSSPIQFAMRKDFAEKYGIKTVKDIAIKKPPIRIVTDNPGTSDEFVGRKIFEFYGVTYNDIEKWGGKVTLTGYTDAKSLITDGHAHLSILNVHDPAGPFVEMQLSVPMVHLKLTDDCLDFLFKKLAHVPHTIPANTYKGQTEEIKTATMFTVAVVNADVPDDVVYRIVKIICENEARFRTFAPAAKAFTAKKAHLGTGIFLHPGARKYFVETGQLK